MNIIPWYEFTKIGTKTGNKGALGYYVDTYEVPDRSGRFLSEVIVWSNYVETPNFSKDSAIIKTLPEFSGYYAYAEKGYPPMETPVDAIVACEGRSHLAIKNVHTKLQVVPYNSYSLNNVVTDLDEFIYSTLAENVGKKYGGDSNVTGSASMIVKIAGLAASLIPHPIVKTALSVTLNLISKAFEVADNAIKYNNGIKESFNASSDYLYVNFVADRASHYAINGKKFVREVENTTASDRYFGPSCHEDFLDRTVNSKFTVNLFRGGTDLNSTQKLKVDTVVNIIDLDFFTQLFEEKKNETFLRSVSVSNEVFYTRAQ